MKQSDKSKNNDDKKICVSVFKSGENTTTKEEYTKKWIELVNRIEKGKSINFYSS